MKNKFYLLLLTTIVFTASCSNDDCGECFTPPNSLYLELLDKETDENLFSNGTYDADQIEILRSIDNSSVGFTFIGENDKNIIAINEIGWKTEKVNLLVNVSDLTLISLFVDVERLSEDCCSYSNFNEIRVSNAESTLDPETGIYQIFIE